jgi:hypothetical protein
MQVMDDDDPGPDFATMQNTKTYVEPAFPPAKIAGWDLNSQTGAAKAAFSHINLRGNFYNSITSVAGGGPPGAPPAPPSGKNLYVELNESCISGVITASEAHHSQAEIGAKDYRLLGEVTNTPRQAINNGVWVQLNSSNWIVPGPSYLTKLVIGQHSCVVAPAGYKLVMTVDDDFDGPNAAVAKTIQSDTTYTGYITITVQPL